MVEALGHNVPRVFMLVFGGGAALAGLAGVIGGNAFVTEPGMAALVGAARVRGRGRRRHGLARRRVPRVAADRLPPDLLGRARLVGRGRALGLGVQLAPGRFLTELASITISQAAPVLPYLLMVLMLISGRAVSWGRGTRERGRSGFKPLDLGRWLVWGGTAVLFVVLPLVFTQGFALTLMSQMGIMIIFALSYNMLLGPDRAAVVRARGVLGPRRLLRGARAEPDRQGRSRSR